MPTHHKIYVSCQRYLRANCISQFKVHSENTGFSDAVFLRNTIKNSSKKNKTHKKITHKKVLAVESCFELEAIK